MHRHLEKYTKGNSISIKPKGKLPLGKDGFF
jgi:hypothetical protein